MAVLNPILVYPACLTEFTVIYKDNNTNVTLTRNDFSINTTYNCLRYDAANVQNIVSGVAANYPEPRISEEQDDVGIIAYEIDFRPEKLYAYTKENIDMYAWTIEAGSEVTPKGCNTIYTKTPVLDITNGVFYDENGVEYTTGPKVTPDLTLKNSTSSSDFVNTSIIEVTDEKITMGATDLD